MSKWIVYTNEYNGMYIPLMMMCLNGYEIKQVYQFPNIKWSNWIIVVKIWIMKYWNFQLQISFWWSRMTTIATSCAIQIMLTFKLSNITHESKKSFLCVNLSHSSYRKKCTITYMLYILSSNIPFIFQKIIFLSTIIQLL